MKNTKFVKIRLLAITCVAISLTLVPLLSAKAQTSCNIDLELIIDRSASIDGMAKSKSIASEFVNLFSEAGNQIGIVKFNSSASTVSNFTSDKAILLSAISSLSGSGNTTISSGINLGLTNLATNTRTTSNKAIVLITDGKNVPDSDSQTITSANTAKSQNIAIYTIGVMGEGNFANYYKESMNASLLTQIAIITGGTFNDGHQAGAVSSLVNKIKSDLCSSQTVTCSTNSQCGTNGYIDSPYCSGGNVYQNYKTYVCSNPGTSTSYCSDSTASQLKTTCSAGQTCSGGSCTTQTVTCSTNSQCGVNGYIDSPYCSGGNVYQNYKTYICNNPGTSTSYCSDSTASQLKTTCSSGQTCSGGSCTTQTVACSTNSQCGTNSYSGSPFCQGNNVYQNYITWTCNNAGNANSYCSSNTTNQLKTTCDSNQTCQNGSCQGNNNCTYHSYQRCEGNYLYWYDSCGVRQDSQYCINGCYNNICQNSNIYSNYLTANQTVRNLTQNTNWSSSTYANPGDMLMFMITIQNTGNQSANNIYVRDNLSPYLIYRNLMTVSNSSYSGDIISGLTISTLPANQTLTITYQAQAGLAQNFNIGSTRINGGVSLTSSNSGYNPVNNSTVFVTKTGVLGTATQVSTGITNNSIIDSFLLPLIAILAIIWMWKIGMFIQLEKWMNSKRLTYPNKRV